MKPKKKYIPKIRTNVKNLNYYIKLLECENKTNNLEQENEITETINNFLKGRRP